MKPVVLIFLATVALAQADYNWDEIFPMHVPDPPHLPLPNGIPSPRITGGLEATPNSFPYQVALFLPVSGGTAFCGGSIITSRTILTAAHCVDSLTGPVEVVLGAHNVRLSEASQVRISSSNIIIHPQWTPSTIRNDIALIILPTAITFNSAIQPIALPSDDSQTYEGQQATVSGWGRASDSSQSISDVLRYVGLPIITNSVCNVAYFGNIFDTNICASGNGGRSTCNGDSGGPLVINGVEVGIVSFGIALGCEIGWPPAFTRVSKYLAFINANSV